MKKEKMKLVGTSLFIGAAVMLNVGMSNTASANYIADNKTVAVFNQNNNSEHEFKGMHGTNKGQTKGEIKKGQKEQKHELKGNENKKKDQEKVNNKVNLHKNEKVSHDKKRNEHDHRNKNKENKSFKERIHDILNAK